MADFNLQVYTQEKKVFDETVTAIQVPGEEGYLGVLANHAPLVHVLGEGKLTIRTGSRTVEHHLSGGFLEVHDNKAVILADSLE